MLVVEESSNLLPLKNCNQHIGLLHLTCPGYLRQVLVIFVSQLELPAHLSSMALFHSLRAPSMSLFLSTKVAPRSSSASMRSCLPTSSRWPIRCSTMCRWPVEVMISFYFLRPAAIKQQPVQLSFYLHEEQKVQPSGVVWLWTGEFLQQSRVKV